MALIDTGLVVRYYIDEAASGTTPTDVSDDSGVGAAFDLAITYDGNMAYSAVATGRGLDSSTTGGDQRARKTVSTGDKVDTALTGVTGITFEIVAQLTSGSASVGRVAVFNENNGSNPLLGMTLTSTLARGWWNETSAVNWTPGTDRKVFHIVYDSTEVTTNNRTRVYENGSGIGVSYGTLPTLNETVDVDPTDLLLFNRESTGNYARSIDGIIYYVAVYATAFSAQNCSDNYDVLVLDDDTPAAPGGGIVVLRRRRQ